MFIHPCGTNCFCLISSVCYHPVSSVITVNYTVQCIRIIIILFCYGLSDPGEFNSTTEQRMTGHTNANVLVCVINPYRSFNLRCCISHPGGLTGLLSDPDSQCVQQRGQGERFNTGSHLDCGYLDTSFHPTKTPMPTLKYLTS